MVSQFNLPILSILLFSVLASCSQPINRETEADEQNAAAASYFATAETGVRDGGVEVIPVTTPKGTFNVWTKRVGNNPRVKLLLLHGGPGANHQYFECMESFLPQEGIEFIYYDQLGSGFSDKPDDTSLWATERFVDELEQVRQALGLNQDNFFLLGHSWGGILAMEYALKHGDNLKGLIVSNMMASSPAYDKYAEDVLAKGLPAEVVDSIRALEAAGDYANPRYMELLLTHFYSRHFCRLPEWPDPLARAMNALNPQVYVTMQGPSEFGISGRLENWDRSADLPKIAVPTLTIGGQYDTMDPKYMEWMASQLPQGRYLHCPNGSHMAMYDDQQVYMKGLIGFLKEADDD